MSETKYGDKLIRQYPCDMAIPTRDIRDSVWCIQHACLQNKLYEWYQFASDSY
jgi:hypothetical protein